MGGSFAKADKEEAKKKSTAEKEAPDQGTTG
jgi:hypothetical protein